MNRKLIAMIAVIGLTILIHAVSPAFAIPIIYTGTNYTSNPTTYDSTTVSIFNVTLNDTVTDGTIDTVFIELNWSGTATNYTMTNGTGYAADTWNYTAVIGANTNNSQYWKIYANNTTDAWMDAANSTYFLDANWTIYQNGTNPVNLNLTYEGATTTNDNISETVDSDKLVTADGYFTYSSSGTISLYLDDASATDGESKTHTAGTHNYKTNTTGNTNYTENATGVTYYFTVQLSGGGGGGGGPPSPTYCGDYICEEAAGESCENCAFDCGTCPTEPTSPDTQQPTPTGTEPTTGAQTSDIIQWAIQNWVLVIIGIIVAIIVLYIIFG